MLPVRYDDTFYRDLLNGSTVALLLRERTSRQVRDKGLRWCAPPHGR